MTAVACKQGDRRGGGEQGRCLHFVCAPACVCAGGLPYYLLYNLLATVLFEVVPWIHFRFLIYFHTTYYEKAAQKKRLKGYHCH